MHPIHVLLVDDSPDIRRLVQAILSSLDVTVTIAENGRQGYDAAMSAWCRGKPFDAILMDYQMPILDGYDAMSMLRLSGYDSPIIAFTSQSLDQERVCRFILACDGYLAKTAQHDDLACLVRALVVEVPALS